MANAQYDSGDDQIFGWRGSARVTDYDVGEQRPTDPEYTIISRIDLPDPSSADVVYAPLINGVTVIHDGGTIAIHDLYFDGGAEAAFLWTNQVQLALI